ncbi:MAG: hypothetical protein K0B08_08775 [Bacteroidales bacterium]|nr:hypothetical protein [Bacteroidales bacterium]
MKPVIVILIIAIAVWACSPAKKVSAPTKAVLSETSQDSTEYELVIIDTRFDNWYLMNYSPAKDRTNEYYRMKNSIAAANWNEYYNSGRYHRAIESYLDYWPNIDYGIELNRKLFWYFKFVEETYKLPLF